MEHLLKFGSIKHWASLDRLRAFKEGTCYRSGFSDCYISHRLAARLDVAVLAVLRLIVIG